MTGKKILVVDDEASVRQLVSSYLQAEGYQVSTAVDGPDALRKARLEKPDLIVLDLMLPEIDGLEITRTLRAESNVYVLMLTAKTEETDKLLGLGMGADDYLTKPFSPRELVARVKAILRRASRAEAVAEVIRADPFEIDISRHRATLADRELDLTAREFDLLTQLVARPGMVFTREQLLEQVWGYNYYGDPRVVDVHIAKLRKKVEKDQAKPQYIKTVRGIGYKLELK